MVVDRPTKLSICIPLLRITKEVQQSLVNLSIGKKQNFNFEIILSFDGVEIVPEIFLPSIIKKNVKIISSSTRLGAAHARNRAVEFSCGEFIAFVDSDVFLPVGFLESWFESQFDPNAYYTSKIMPINGESIIAQSFSTLALRKKIVGPISFITTATSWLSRELFYKVGCFNENFKDAAGEDSEFCLRANKLNVPIIETNLITYHRNPTTLKEFKSRAVRYASKGYLFHEELVNFNNSANYHSNLEVKNQIKIKVRKQSYRVFRFTIKLLKNPKKNSMKLVDLFLNRTHKRIKKRVHQIKTQLKQVENQHGHYFLTFTRAKKALFILLALIWTSTYKRSLPKRNQEFI